MSIDKEIKELNKQLYPTGRAWNFVHGSEQVDTEITQFVDGLNNQFVDGFGNHFISVYGSEASPSKRLINAFLESYIRLYTDILSILNTIIPDNDEFSAVDAGNWERVYAILNNAELTLDERKQAINRKIAYPNGIPERAHYLFIQDQLQANGFGVYVTENRFTDGGAGWEVFDPNTINTTPYQFGLFEFGTAEFGGEIAGLDYTILANNIDEAKDETFFDAVLTESGFGLFEFGISQFGTPEQSTRDEKLRFTFFIGGSSFPNTANVPIERKNEFRELLLKLKPLHSVIFLYINYI